jgi:hypothetical protein
VTAPLLALTTCFAARPHAFPTLVCLLLPNSMAARDKDLPELGAKRKRRLLSRLFPLIRLLTDMHHAISAFDHGAGITGKVVARLVVSPSAITIPRAIRVVSPG